VEATQPLERGGCGRRGDSARSSLVFTKTTEKVTEESQHQSHQQRRCSDGQGNEEKRGLHRTDMRGLTGKEVMTAKINTEPEESGCCTLDPGQ
jgi:hypothetical protein